MPERLCFRRATRRHKVFVSIELTINIKYYYLTHYDNNKGGGGEKKKGEERREVTAATSTQRHVLEKHKQAEITTTPLFPQGD